MTPRHLLAITLCVLGLLAACQTSPKRVNAYDHFVADAPPRFKAFLVKYGGSGPFLNTSQFPKSSIAKLDKLWNTGRLEIYPYEPERYGIGRCGGLEAVFYDPLTRKFWVYEVGGYSPDDYVYGPIDFP